jgi:hypothetical protein
LKADVNNVIEAQTYFCLTSALPLDTLYHALNSLLLRQRRTALWFMQHLRLQDGLQDLSFCSVELTPRVCKVGTPCKELFEKILLPNHLILLAIVR